MVPRRVGRYEILGQLATGGMAEILLARLSGPAQFARAVVIKRILRQYAKDPSFVTMFLDEARTVAKIRHPNVVQVHELGEDEGEVFLVLEYVAGENLSGVLKRAVAASEPLEPALVAHIAAEACAGLHAAHELVSESGRHQRLVHRDVSPQNLFVSYHGHVKLLDFGVALTEERGTRTEAGDVKGKFEYMSPEQTRGQPLDRRSDIFAMGIVLYELGTGRRLFKRNSPARTLDAICIEPVLPPSRLAPNFPPALEAIILKALAKDPSERFATAAEMRRELQAVAHTLASPSDALAERMQRWFPDRIAEKEEMLRRLADGHEVSHVPAGEAFENVPIPQVPDQGATLAHAATELASVRRAPRPSRLWPVLVAFAAVLAVLAVVVPLRLARRRPDAVTVAETASATAVPPPPSATPSAVVPVTPPEVLVHIESTPAGAHVFVAGEERGVTPLDVHVARGTDPVAIELRRAGYPVAQQIVVPDVDQKLVLVLGGRRAAGVPKPPPATSGTGFRRFD